MDKPKKQVVTIETKLEDGRTIMSNAVEMDLGKDDHNVPVQNSFVLEINGIFYQFSISGRLEVTRMSGRTDF